MDLINRKFANYIAVAAFAISCFLFLFNFEIGDRKGIFEVLGGEIKDRNEVVETSYSEGATGSFKAFAARTKPTLSFNTQGADGRIRAGAELHLKSYFTGTDCDGKEVEQLSFLNIEDSTGNSLIDSYNEETDTFSFPNAGIYTITCQIKDDENLESTVKLEIPVDN